MDFSADLLHAAISGLALPRVETANCVDLGQMIWGVMASGQTSDWNLKPKQKCHLSFRW